MRFSARPAGMIRFLEVLGLRRVLESENGAYATFEGAAGSVAVHSVAGADSGVAEAVTSLNVLVADVDAAAAALRAAGLDAEAWDEAYGRQGAVRTPRGTTVGLNEATQADLYGYRVIGGEPGVPLTDEEKKKRKEQHTQDEKDRHAEIRKHLAQAAAAPAAP